MFLKKSIKKADRAGDKTKDDHQIDESDEFHVTHEQLDESMDETSSTDLNTIHFDADNESTESFARYEFTIVGDAEGAAREPKNANKTKAITIERVVKDGDHMSERTTPPNLKMKKSPIAFKTSPSSEVNNMEYQDKVFGDLVSAMLAKMTPEKKKQAKKEIMNILL